jgi:hypothetical protein
MFHITRELEPLKNGLNFYPWSERKSVGIGVKLKIGRRMWAIRYSPHLRKIYTWKLELSDG